ncbi:hypothetical protein ASD24_24180 [Paenibacillus sp. Root52]|nr:hypothetical protein ASD24_24180 [Paenibacillus sp. Root52]
MTQNRKERMFKNLARSSPISIPSDATIKARSKVGYEQISFNWSDGFYKYESRWHTRTPNAPIEQGNTWVVERLTPGNTTGQQKTSHILIGPNQWISKYEWQAAIRARTQGTSTPEQVKVLDDGHWPAP